jgi:hypothetical protein
MPNYYLPGFSAQATTNSTDAVYAQAAPLYHQYSPRLFGAPPQLTNQCDMRLKSSTGSMPGPVGDYYLDRILREGQIVNFCVGHALFTGGMSSIGNTIRTIGNYAYALSKYSIFNESGSAMNTSDVRYGARIYSDSALNSYKKSMSDTSTNFTQKEGDPYRVDVNSDPTTAGILKNIGSIFENMGGLSAGGALLSSITDSLSVQQPFYTFESDWYTYINNVKMMINTAIMMLGLNGACVRIGDELVPIGLPSQVNVEDGRDVWSRYRFITADDGVSTRLNIDNLSGETHQYVSFMVNPVSPNESISNTQGESQIYSTVLSAGSGIGDEIAFLTNSTSSKMDDALLDLTTDVIGTAEKVMSKLTGNIGGFTASIASSFARSFMGDHTIYPKIFKNNSATTSISLTVQLKASGGDPYSYLIDILVPLFHLMCLALPAMSKNAASAYSYPPLVQCNIPGIWGSRMAIIQSLSIDKNPDGNDFSINGYPLAVNVTINVEDLQHVLVTTPMHEPAMMLNNHTMFDYIAQCAGVDKYRINGSIRVVSRIALAALAGGNVFANFGDAIMNDAHTFVNRMTGASRM